MIISLPTEDSMDDVVNSSYIETLAYNILFSKESILQITYFLI